MIKGLTDFCWFFFKWATALALVVALGASPFIYRKLFFRVEEEVRNRVEERISQCFPQAEVHVHSAHLGEDGIVARGISIIEPGALGPQPEIAYFDEVLLACRTSLQELISSEPVITGIRISHPVIRATRRPDGTFSLGKLLPLPKQDRPMPPLTIENGSIVVFDPLKNPSSTLTLREVNVTIKPASAAPADGELHEIQGYLVGDQIQRVEIVGNVDPRNRRWTVSGTVDNLEISPELCDSLPQQLSEPLAVLRSLRATANLSFRATSAEPGQLPHFEINGRVAHGRLEDPMLTYPVTDLEAEIHCDNGGIRMRRVTARHGPATWQVSDYKQQGFGAGSPFELHANGRQVRLDPKWATTLPAPWCNYWKDYDPDGDVDIDGTLVYDGERVTPSLEVTGLENVSFSFRKFPYRLERARGRLTLRDKVLDAAIVAYSGDQPLSINGRIHNPGPQYFGWVRIHGDKIEFDAKLGAALLKPKARETLRSLNPRGTFDIDANIGRDDPRQREPHQFATIKLNRCSINYSKFPVPLNNVEGVLHLRDGQWQSASELVGTNGTGVVRLSGNLATGPDYEELRLTIDAKNFPLHEELRDALSPSQRQLWVSLQPHGKIDLSANVRYESRSRKTSVTLRAVPRDDSTIGTSIEPVAFPYRMRIVGGAIDYQDGHAVLKNLHAVHGTTHMLTGGTCDFSPGGSWQLQLRDLSVNRLRLHGEDHDLEAALPEALKRAIAELKPTGQINLKGAVDFAKSQPDAPLHTGWDVDLILHRASLQVGPKLDNIFGRVQLTGAADGPRYASRGELALDSLTYKNFQFTEIHGPLWFDNGHVVLGAAGGQLQQPRTVARRVTARLLGGTLAGDCYVKLGPVPHYHLVATLSQADLGQFARENLTGHQRLNGKILANLDLHGDNGPQSLLGTGNIHLTDADVYELPVMVSLLKIPRAKLPDASAFNQSDIVFDIRGEHITLNQIHLYGDAVSLSGMGELTLDGQTNPINLRLHTKVGRGNVPILNSMLSEASRQIMVFHVSGTLDNPVARTEAFPGANQALQQLQPDRERTSFFPQDGPLLRAMGLRR